MSCQGTERYCLLYDGRVQVGFGLGCRAAVALALAWQARCTAQAAAGMSLDIVEVQSDEVRARVVRHGSGWLWFAVPGWLPEAEAA